MLAVFQSLAMVLGSRLVLLVAVIVAAGLGATAAVLDTVISTVVFGLWSTIVVGQVTWLDWKTRSKGG